MKKIILCILLLIICGCENNQVANNQDDKWEVRQLTLKEKAKLTLTEDIETDELKITFLYSIINGLSNNSLFDSCDKDMTRIEYSKYKIDNEIYSQYKIILDCDNEIRTYFYDNLNDIEPIHISSVKK